jgi:nucleoside triphosphatase
MIYPEPIVCVFILNDKGELLLLSSPKWKDLSIVPGGHIELKETIQDALIREVKEETDLELNNIQFLNIDEYIETTATDEVKHYIFLNHCGTTATTYVTLNEEAEQYRWVLPKDALNLKITASTKKVIETYLLK